MAPAFVVDTSAVLAILFDEAGGERVGEVWAQCVISTVNTSEVIAKLIDKGLPVERARLAYADLRMKQKEFDGELAYSSGLLREATRRKGLSLGDRACLALARREGATVLTADRAWAGLDVGVEIEIIR